MQLIQRWEIDCSSRGDDCCAEIDLAAFDTLQIIVKACKGAVSRVQFRHDFKALCVSSLKFMVVKIRTWDDDDDELCS